MTGEEKANWKLFGRIRQGKKSSTTTHIVLFILTFLTCMMSGAQWAFKDASDILNWGYGFQYAVLILTFLSAHEFGHYFAAKYHKVDATLPYYIPFPIPGAINFGTFGAVIRTINPIPNRKALFDIGAAGPLAGFVVAFGFLIYGFATLPPIAFIYQIHPEYVIQNGGHIPTNNLHFGDTILYWICSKLFANPNGWLPPMNEMYHYPFLNVGWFGLFVTSLNMLPFGQLDGGHIAYSMFGKKQHNIAKWGWRILISIGIFSLISIFRELLLENYANMFIIKLQNILLPPLNWINTNFLFLFRFWPGWLFWALLTKFFIKLPHPEVGDNEDIGATRKVLGWLAFAILILCFSYNGLYVIE